MNLIRRVLSGVTLMAAALSGTLPAQGGTFVGGRSDFRDETIYFAMTTRFYDGDITNNTYCWDGKNNVNDPEWRGDFKGLIAKLDYLKALGFTAIWITPIVENASGLDYHGYHAINFQKVDHRYESSDVKFQDLIDAVHAKGMKLILDIVLQHTGNFGEEYLCPMFTKNYDANPSNINKYLSLHEQTTLPSNYASMQGGEQYAARLARMKNTDGQNHDNHNYWHHVGNNWDFDDYSRVWGQIAGDCVDLNTENPVVSNYLVKCYTKFIEMGVDGFRVDTSGHIARLTFNKAFIPQLHAAAEKYKSKRGGSPFFIFGEVCARAEEVIYRNGDYNTSPCFYTWAETKDYAWDTTEGSWDQYTVMEGQFGDHTNAKSVLQQGKDYAGQSNMATSTNHALNGNDYHTPDYSKSSKFNVIDFPMHWRFYSAENAFGVRSQDNLYNDATYNVVYVDSHDYGPNTQDRQRFAGGTAKWAENLDLMFTWRGIPCIFYGSEVEFQAGKTIDEGPNLALKNSGRAYFGGYLEGSVSGVSDFGVYSNATGNMAYSLTYPLARHIRRLNLIRAAVPALRKGQYSTDGCSGKMAFKRRYTDSSVDSYVLVTISGSATFTNILNGTYTDCITGDVKTVTDNKLTATCSGTGNMRVYVRASSLTPAPGKIGEDGKFLYNTASVNQQQTAATGSLMPDETTTQRDNSGGTMGGGGSESTEPAEPITPTLYENEYAAFFENSWGGSVYAWVWSSEGNYTGGSWPGVQCENLGNNIWKWSILKKDTTLPDDTQIIFSNGGSQTSDMAFVNGGYYTSEGLKKTLTTNGEEKPEPVLEEHEWVLYYHDTNWSNVNCYFWDAYNNRQYLGGWPGRAMTNTGDRWEIRFTTTDDIQVPMCIFNNGDQQTVDLVAENYGIYKYNGIESIDPSKPDEPEPEEPGQGGIESVDGTTSRLVVAIYDLFGRSISEPQPGMLYIIRYSDGTTVKAVRR